MADDDVTWAVLLHRPTDGRGAAVFGDPRFADHVRFLQRLLGDGHLVAAGPLPDEPGAGMTVVRFPGAHRIDEIAAVAEREDPSVAGDLFTVTVRPWDVRMVGAD